MQSFPRIAVSSGYIEEFNGTGDVFSHRLLPLEHSALVKFAKKRSPLSHPAVIFQKNAIVKVGGYPNIYPEDYLLWIRVIQDGFQIGNIPHILVKMRTGDGFLSRRGWRFFKGEIYIYRYMLNTDFINFFEFLFLLFSRAIVRLSPNWIKILLYRYMR